MQGEIGYVPKDVCGLGPGIYRIQPFLARAGGPIQAGVGFNFQQQLGPDSPLGVFARAGFGGSDVSAGAKAQVGAGFVLYSPFPEAVFNRKRDNDLLGVGLVWSQPSDSTSVFHENEYVLEAFYTLQLSPTTKIQPDLQVVWDPAFNPDSGPAVVIQIQMVLTW
jgi:porin